MPSLFGGVENFTPAFTGQQLAIQAGQGAGASISRGMQTAQKGKQQQFEQDIFKETAKQSQAMGADVENQRRQGVELDKFMSELDTHLRGKNLGSSPENEWLNFQFGQGSIIPG